MHRAFLTAALLAIPSGPVHAQDCPIEGLVQTIGTGTAGSAGELRLVHVGAPLLDQTLRVELRGGAALSSGLVLLGNTAAPVPLPEFGGVAQILPPYLVAAVGFDAQGNSTPAFEWTPVPDFCGSQAFLQGLCIDGTAAGGLSLSHALRLRFGGVQQGPLFPQPTAELDLFPLSITSGDLNGDGMPDLVGVGRVDVRTLLNQVLEHSGSKDCNGIDDADDIETGFSQDCNQNGIPDECDLLFGGATDSDLDGQLDECETVAYFSEDFEAGAAGWNFNAPEASIWHVAPDGECGAVTQVAAFNRGPVACDYASELVPQGSLESPAFTLDGAGPFTLSFTNRVDIAPGSIATLFVVLQRTTDPGTTFTIDGVSFDTSGVLEELSFDIPNTAEWAGYEARLRFQFIGGIGANAGSGWQIDNVSVTSAP